MRKVFHLSTCNTCQKIIKETNANAVCGLQDIKTQSISAEDLDWLASKVGSYEALFSRKALKFRSLGLHEKVLTEGEYRDLILQEYTSSNAPSSLLMILYLLEMRLKQFLQLKSIVRQ